MIKFAAQKSETSYDANLLNSDVRTYERSHSARLTGGVLVLTVVDATIFLVLSSVPVLVVGFIVGQPLVAFQLAILIGVLFGFLRYIRLGEHLTEFESVTIEREQRFEGKGSGERVVIEMLGSDDEGDEMPVSKAVLALIANQVLAGHPFSRALCTKVRGFSQADYKALRERFVAVGYARYKDENNHNQGVIVTSKGMAVFKGVATRRVVYPSTLLDNGSKKSVIGARQPSTAIINQQKGGA